MINLSDIQSIVLRTGCPLGNPRLPSKVAVTARISLSFFLSYFPVIISTLSSDPVSSLFVGLAYFVYKEAFIQPPEATIANEYLSCFSIDRWLAFDKTRQGEYKQLNKHWMILLMIALLPLYPIQFDRARSQ